MQAQQSQRSLLLEFQGAGGPRRQAADPPAEFGDTIARLRVGQDPEPERQRGRADIEPPLYGERQGHRGQIVLTEVPVKRRGTVSACPDRRQQAQALPVAEHAWRGAEPARGFGDAHSR